MPYKLIIKQILLTIFATGFAVSSLLLFYFIQSGKDNGNLLVFIKDPFSITLEEKQATPVRLKIPTINVNAEVESVGLTSSGDMDIPQNSANVAWYQSGPHPGEMGSAVIAGHYGWKNDQVSIFDNLYKLKVGDKIYVEDEDNNLSMFIVSKIEKFDLNANTTDIFNSTDGMAHLNLITCSGIWDKVTQSYEERLIVFADKN